MSAARHPRIDGLIERVDETMQISVRCYSSGHVFWLGISYTHSWFLLHVFNQWDLDTFKVPYDLLADYLINYGKWLMNRLSWPATCLSWQVFRMLFESWHSPSNMASRSSRLAAAFALCDLVFLSSKASLDQNIFQFFTSIMLWWTLGLFAVVHFSTIIDIIFFICRS